MTDQTMTTADGVISEKPKGRELTEAEDQALQEEILAHLDAVIAQQQHKACAFYHGVPTLFDCQ